MDEFFDEGLMGIMGDRYVSSVVPKGMPALEVEPKAEPKESKQEELLRMVVAEENPFPKPKRGTMDRLLEMCIWLLVCGMISYTMWWFEVNNLMAMEASYPCVLVSAIVGAAGTTWSAMRK